MKLQFMGTGSIGSSCFSACTVVNDDVLIDMPNGIIKYMKKINVEVEKIRYIFITHFHGDHFDELPFYMIYKYANKCSYETVVYGPKGIKEKVVNLMELIFPNAYEDIKDKINVRFVEHNGEEVELENGIKVKPIPVIHENLKPAYGYMVFDVEHSVGFSGDSMYNESIDEIIENTEMSILDTNFPYDGNDAHMGVSDIEKLCQKYADKKIVCIHMSDGARERALNLDVRNVIVPEDGTVINL